MKPTASDVHVNAPLTNISIAFMQMATAFVANRAFPLVPVQKQSDRYFEIDRGEFNRDQMQKRAPGTEAAEGGFTFTNTSSYYCDVWGLKHPIPDEVRANADSPIADDIDGVDWLTTQDLIRKEKAWAADFFTTGVWTTDVTGVAAGPTAGQTLQWNDVGADILKDVTVGRRIVHESTGFNPNVLVIGRRVWDDGMKNNADILDRVKYGQVSGAPAMVSPNLVAQLMELDEILIMDAVENTANEGAANVHSYIGGKKALLLYRPPRPALRTPSAGYTFVWAGLTGLNDLGVRIERRRVDAKHADEVEIGSAWDQKKIAADLGYFFTSIVA